MDEDRELTEEIFKDNGIWPFFIILLSLWDWDADDEKENRPD